MVGTPIATWYTQCMLLLFLVLIVAIIFAAYRLYPPFGGVESKNAWKASKNFQGRIFVNQITTSMEMKLRDMPSLFHDMMRRSTMRKPAVPIQPDKPDIKAMLASKKPQVMWLGHSSTLMKIGGKIIMTDPMLSKRASPFPFAGPKRVVSEIPLSAEELPPIDAVVISHNHYDHLDYATIKKLKHKTTKFFVPLGLATHLRTWGVRDEQIVEMDWWDKVEFEGITFVCTPSRHFSGRTLTDRFKTLWCSWVIQATDASLFFSGDTGYGPHFKQIGKKYGPFDITLMECGQYNEHWAHIHMTPEQTFTAHQDLRGKRLVPVHWGAFVLALHTWTDSVVRVKKAADAAGVHIATPRIGEPVPMKATAYPKSAWWEKHLSR